MSLSMTYLGGGNEEIFETHISLLASAEQLVSSDLTVTARIDQLSVWRLNHCDKKQAIQAACSCSVSFCSVSVSLL